MQINTTYLDQYANKYNISICGSDHQKIDLLRWILGNIGGII